MFGVLDASSVEVEKDGKGYRDTFHQVGVQTLCNSPAEPAQMSALKTFFYGSDVCNILF